MHPNPIDTNAQTNPPVDANLQKYEALSQERKALQDKGHVPLWYNTPAWQMFREKYIVPGEDAVYGRHKTIARTLSRHMVGREKEWEDRFFNLLWNGILSPASPALANTGTDRGMMVSCSGQYVEDSVYGFYSSNLETAILSQWGFGTSADFSAVRARGSLFGTNGKANGAVSVINDFFTTAAKISQGGNRRGSIGAYLDIEHADWDEACDELAQDPNGKNYGWIIRDSFVDRLKNGDKDADRRWEKAIYTKLITGKGYIFCVDKANRHRPQMYKDHGLDVKASNLCVAPETLILTRQGHRPIASLVGQDIQVWNGEAWSSTVVVQTGQNQPLLKVNTDLGQSLECTPYHKFYVMDGYSKVVEVRAHALKPGDKLIKWEAPVIEGEQPLLQAYENGFYSGDGCDVDGKARIYLYGEKRDLLPMFPTRLQHYVQHAQNREYFYVPGLRTKFFVPDVAYTIASRLLWLAGLLDADGCVVRNGTNQAVQLASVQEGFLEQVQLMLQTLGVHSKIRKVREAGQFHLPANDGSGAMKLFACQEVKRLLISSSGVQKLQALGLSTQRLILERHTPQRNAEQFIKVLSVEDTGRTDDTFCFTEPKRHMGVFNGLLTGQCSEIMLHSSKDYTYSCILSSMNLVHWDTIKTTEAVFESMVFLDCLCSEFIDKAKDIPGLEKVRAFTEMGRATGLGVMGFHSYLQDKEIPYIGLEAQFINREIAKHLHDESLRASQWLAKEYGEPAWCKGYGVRNTHRTAFAPTKSTANLMGGVSESTFPDPGAVFDAGTSVGEIRRIVPAIYRKMKERGVYNDATVKDIIDHLGSVQHVDWLTDKEKQVFLFAFEMDQRILFRHHTQRQPYICQGQSLNFYVPEDGSEPLIAELMTMVLLDENCLSQYYIYSRSGIVVKDECISCAG